MARIETYVSLDQIKGALDKQTTTNDDALLLILEAASMAIDNYCHRPDGFLADADVSARVYSSDGSPVLQINECVEVTLVGVKDSPTEDTYTAWAPGDWLAFSGDIRRPNFQPLSQGKPYTALMVSATGDESHFTSGRYSQLSGFRPSFTQHRGVPMVQVTAKWGYSVAVPGAVRQACLITSSRWFRRGLSQWADAVGNPDMGQMFYRRGLDPAAQMILREGGYKRGQIG